MFSEFFEHGGDTPIEPVGVPGSRGVGVEEFEGSVNHRAAQRCDSWRIRQSVETSETERQRARQKRLNSGGRQGRRNRVGAHGEESSIGVWPSVSHEAVKDSGAVFGNDEGTEVIHLDMEVEATVRQPISDR